jgi:hypothetical protein
VTSFQVKNIATIPSSWDRPFSKPAANPCGRRGPRSLYIAIAARADFEYFTYTPENGTQTGKPEGLPGENSFS